MKKKVTELIVCLLSVICFLTACHTPQSEKLADGTYQADVTLTGGSGRATVDSPAAITVKDGKIYATIVWSSPYYDYMMVEDETCYNEAEAGENSTFTIPIEKLPCEISVIADTTAMSVPDPCGAVICVKRDGLCGTDEDGAVGSLLCHAVSCGTIRGV